MTNSLLRLLLGIVIAGMWPGMTYYLSLFYPPSRMGKRIGQYFTASQVSAAVVGLVSAGFQKMDGLQGLVGFQWMFLVYGVVTTAFGIVLLWWLPPRPTPPPATFPANEKSNSNKTKGNRWWYPQSPAALHGRDAEIHYHDLKRVYHRNAWTWRDLVRVVIDWRLWPLLIMYFGVVGVGIGTQSYGTIIIRATNPALSDINLSLLFAPIWIVRVPPPSLPLSLRHEDHPSLTIPPFPKRWTSSPSSW
jgi:MFS family permease